MSRLFIPAITPPANWQGPAWWFAFAGDKLLYDPNSPTGVPQSTDLDLPRVRQQYLGMLDGQPCYSAEVDAAVLPPPGMVFRGLRQLFEVMPDDILGVAGRAVQIVEWDRTHQFCGRCGSTMVSATTERAKLCPRCGLTNYPRLSPSIIVAVRRGSELLLARSPRFRPGMYSILAGFVEPGETLEETVEREVWEEVNIRLANIRYFGSQPWPFPHSLMIGFTADYAAGEIHFDGVEIEDAGWYTAATLPDLPPRLSIARRLIEDFLVNSRET